MDHQMTLGERIRARREAAGLSLEALVRAGEAAGVFVTAKAIQKWETGEAMPGLTYVAWLARHFGVTVDELLNLSGTTEHAEHTERGQA